MGHDAFGTFFRSVRERTGKSMSAVCRHLGVSTAYLSEVEQGKRAPLTRENILKAAEFLNTDPLPLIMAASEWSGELALRVKKTSQRAREVGASLVLRWESLSEKDLEAIAKIIKQKEINIV